MVSEPGLSLSFEPPVPPHPDAFLLSTDFCVPSAELLRLGCKDFPRVNRPRLLRVSY